ncbi:MAG: hypothetical protein V3V05_02410 [Pontiella sp.]
MSDEMTGAGWNLNRMDFLKTSGAVISGLSTAHADTTETTVKLRFGILTDPHYADVAPKGSRYYRESKRDRNSIRSTQKGFISLSLMQTTKWTGPITTMATSNGMMPIFQPTGLTQEGSVQNRRAHHRFYSSAARPAR